MPGSPRAECSMEWMLAYTSKISTAALSLTVDFASVAARLRAAMAPADAPIRSLSLICKQRIVSVRLNAIAVWFR